MREFDALYEEIIYRANRTQIFIFSVHARHLARIVQVQYTCLSNNICLQMNGYYNELHRYET